MEQNNTVSIIVPVYNTAAYLDRCVQSLLAQTYKNIEILLIDDGSTDNSWNICLRYAQENENVHAIHKENGGISETRNTGMHAAQGEYIAFVDSDDCVDERMVDVCLRALQKYGADIAGFAWQGFSDILPPVTYKKKVVVKQGKSIEPYFLEKNRLYCAVRYMYKKELIERNEVYFDPIIQSGGEDQQFIFRYIKYCNRAVFLRYNGYFYFENMQSATAGMVKENHYNDLRVRKEICENARKDCKRRAKAHLWKGYLAFCIKAIKYGSSCQEDIITAYRKIVRRHLGAIIFSPYIESKYKAAAVCLHCSVALTKKLSEKTQL